MKIAKIIFICIFCVCISIVPLILQLSSIDIELEEKRTPAEFPTEFSDDYFEKINEWYVDHSPLREAFIWLYNQFDEKVEKPFFDALANNQAGTDEPESLIDEDVDFPYPYLDRGQTYYPLKIKNDVIYGRDDWLFLSGDNSLDYYSGANIKTNEEMAVQLQLLQNLTDWGKAVGVNVVFFVAPNKEQVYADKMPTVTIQHPAKYLQRFRKYAEDYYKVNFIYPLEELIDGRKIADTYLMQDTHWNDYGAYIGYSQILKHLGLKFVEDTIIYKENTTGGDLANMLGIAGVSYDTGKVKLAHPVSYTTAGSNTAEGYEFVSTINDGSHLYLIGDSFRNRLVPFFACNYDRITSMHFLYTDPNNPNKKNYNFFANAMKDVKPGDTIIIEIVERYMSYIETIFQSVWATSSQYLPSSLQTSGETS